MTLPPNVGPAANSYTASISLAGFRDARPDLGVDGVLTPAGRSAVQQAETLCKLALDKALAGMTPSGSSGAAGIAARAGRRADAYLGTPTDGYDRPIFLGVDCVTATCRRRCPSRSTNGCGQRPDVTLKVYPDQTTRHGVGVDGDSTPSGGAACSLGWTNASWSNRQSRRCRQKSSKATRTPMRCAEIAEQYLSRNPYLTGCSWSLADVRLLAPILASKVVCMARTTPRMPARWAANRPRIR